MKKSKNLFWKIYAVVLVCVCIICTLALIVGYNIMKDYDKSQRFVPDTAAEYAEKISNGDYSCLLDTEVKPATLVFEEDTFLQAVKEKVEKAGSCTYKKGFSTDRYEKPVYLLMAGDEEIAELQFEKQSEKTTFGFDTYKLTSVKPALSGNYELVLLVPQNGTLYINDIEVPETYKTGETFEQSTQENLFEKTGDLETLEYYKIEGLMKDVTMSYSETGSGEKLALKYSSAKEAWIVKNVNTEITIVAPSNVDVYINDTKISGEERFTLKTGVEIEEIQTSKQYVTCDVTLTTYTVSGLPEGYVVSGKGFDGTAATYTFDEETQTYTFKNGIWPSDLSVYGVTNEYLKTRAEEYAKFVSNDGSRDTNVLPYVYDKAQVYKDFKEFWATLSKHNSYWIENEEITDVEFYNAELFKATVKFDYWIKGFNHQTDNTKCYPNNITFWYGKINGSWKIIDYSLN